MNGKSQMQGGKNRIFAEIDQCKPVLLGLSLVGNLIKSLLSLYGTEWRERGYGLRGSRRVDWTLDKQARHPYHETPQLLSSQTETTFHYCWRVKSSFELVWMESTSTLQLPD